MNAITFRNLSPREFDKHRGTCPFEMGRFHVEKGEKTELIGPLPIYKIFSEASVGHEIEYTDMEISKFLGPIAVFEGSDGVLYTLRDSIYYSITKILEK